jgi:hypothetical protein
MYSTDINGILNHIHSANALASVFLSNPTDSNANQLNEELKVRNLLVFNFNYSNF